MLYFTNFQLSIELGLATYPKKINPYFNRLWFCQRVSFLGRVQNRKENTFIPTYTFYLEISGFIFQTSQSLVWLLFDLSNGILVWRMQIRSVVYRGTTCFILKKSAIFKWYKILEDFIFLILPYLLNLFLVITYINTHLYHFHHSLPLFPYPTHFFSLIQWFHE